MLCIIKYDIIQGILLNVVLLATPVFKMVDLSLFLTLPHLTLLVLFGMSDKYIFKPVA